MKPGIPAGNFANVVFLELTFSKQLNATSERGFPAGYRMNSRGQIPIDIHAGMEFCLAKE
jgi:hypothetical protein